MSMALIPCIACRKEVLETLPICPYCGTPSPKRVMLVPCRVCGEEVGKTARRCPHCTNPHPYKKRYIREYLLLIPAFLGVYFLFNIDKPNTLEIVTTLVLWFLVWFYFQNLKDFSGLMKFFPVFFPGEKTLLFPTCAKCQKKIFNKTKPCPNCGEPVPKVV
jgi:predicted amidophosphoribosyltransferase